MRNRNSSVSMKNRVKLKASDREVNNIVLKANTSISALPSLLFQAMIQQCGTEAGSLTCASLPE